eukprot:snap_masked-scaffold_17-processed-gene-5.12-mRNA-1 protein AED:1.00 eAED:1.00 QI:0/0/0/0/1/1/2/0/686
MATLLAAVGTVFALIALALCGLLVTIEDYVVLEIPTNEQDQSSTSISNFEKVASLGVFTTTYSTEDLTDYTLQNSGVPDDSFSQPTTEFKLLFPAQENFLSEILPINSDLLSNLPEQLSAILQPSVTNLESVEFESCSQWVNDTSTNLLSTFSAVNDVLMPNLLPSLLDPQLILDVASAIENTSLAFEAGLPFGSLIPFSFQLFQTASTFTDACSALNSQTLSSLELNATTLACIQGTYTAFSTSFSAEAPLVSSLLLDVSLLIQTSCFEAAITSLEVCLTQTLPQHFLLSSTDTLFNSSFSTDICSVLSACEQTVTTKAELYGILSNTFGQLGSLVELLSPENAADIIALEQGTGLLASAAVFLQSLTEESVDSDLVSELESIATDLASTESLPDSFVSIFAPCTFLQVVGQGPSNPGECTFLDFLSSVASLALEEENPLAETVSQLSTLYGICASIAAPQGLGADSCELIFPNFFIHATFLLGLDLTSFNTIPEQALGACEDDATDREHFTRAQYYIFGASSAYVLSALLALGILFFKWRKKKTFFLQVFFAVIAPGLTFAALYETQTAPIYDLVGVDEDLSDEERLFTAEYSTGTNLLFAFGAMGSSLLAGLFFLFALCRARSERKASIELFKKRGRVEIEEEQKEREEDVQAKLPFDVKTKGKNNFQAVNPMANPHYSTLIK